MAEEIGFENGRNSNFQGLVTLTLTLDPPIRHTVVHHSSTSTYTPIFIQIEETFSGRTDGRTYGRTFSPSLILLGRLLEVDLITDGHCDLTASLSDLKWCRHSYACSIGSISTTTEIPTTFHSQLASPDGKERQTDG